MKLPVVDESAAGKKVFVRGDIDVPLSNPVTQLPSNSIKTADDTRLKDIWVTIEYLLNRAKQVIVAGHLGRPGGKVVPELSSWPVAQWLRDTPDGEVVAIKLGNFPAFQVSDRLIVLENLRFDPREEENDEGLARELAGLADVYVNEAFAASYENHASLVSIPKFLPHYAGFRLAKEVEVLGEVLEHPKRPLLVIIGGAKLDTKLPVINKMAEFADHVIVGGKLAEEYKVSSIMYKDKVAVLDLDESGKDISLNTLYMIHNTFLSAAAIVWNGPFGKIEEEEYQAGTKKIVELILQNKTAFKVVGGGDTVAFLDKLGVTGKFDWVSSGGGSMLKFLAGEKLPGVEALLPNDHK